MRALNILLLYVTLTFAVAKESPKIAIVGGGIGGTSCAYFLRKLFGPKTKLTLFERDIIGGRLNLVNIDGNYYESGGSVIHPSNKYMMDFTKLLGLSVKKPASTSSKFGIYDGEKFAFMESDWYIITIINFLWRYGLSVFDIWKEIKSMLNDFSSIYKLQEKEFAFTTVSGLLDDMNPNFRNMTQETILSILTKKKFSSLFLEELVQSVMMVNYGQTNNISGFAGFVSLAGSDNNLWCVRGGNKLVPEGLLKESRASIINGDVQEIILESDRRYSLKYNETSHGEVKTENYDIVVLASPLIKDQKNIKFSNFQKSFEQYESPFHRTVATFVKGTLNPLAFNTDIVLNEILTFKNTLLFNSISEVTPVDDTKVKGNRKVYKVFSQQPLITSDINAIFKNIEMVKVKNWLAYPHYKPPENLVPFMLHPGLYYTNSIELAASAMEMSAIAGRNVALLAFNLWNNMDAKVDHHKQIFRDEL